MTGADQEREPEDFEAFATAAWPRLRRAAWLLTHDSHDAEDLVQTALAETFARWPRVTREGAYAYVRRALVNGYIDSIRRRHPVPVERVVEAPAQSETDVIDVRSELSDLLAPLSPRERSIIVWRYYLDTSEEEVARRLGISLGTVKSTASRARARLRSSRSTARGGQR